MWRQVGIGMVVVALGVAACGDDGSTGGGDTAADTVGDTGGGDTGGGDTGGDAPGDAELPPVDEVERLDWVDERGAPLAGTRATHSDRIIVAAHADGVVTGRGCGAETGCDYAWLDVEGIEVAARPGRYPAYSSIVPATGTQLALVALDSYELCGPGPSYKTVLAGTYELIDIASGALAWSQPLRTNVFREPAFMPAGDWFKVDALEPGACDGVSTWRAASAPYAPAAYADPAFYPSGDLPGGRWLGFRGDTFGVVDPEDAESFVGLGDQIDDWAVGAGWVHGFDGYGDSTEVVRVLAPDGQRFDVPLPGDDLWRGQSARGRWMYACTARAVGSLVACGIFDARGEVARRDVLVDTARPTVVLFGEQAAVVRTYDTRGEPVALRIDLVTGAEVEVGRGPGTVHVLGDGEAVLVASADRVVLVEEARTEVLLEPERAPSVTALTGIRYGAPLPDGRAPPRHRAIATIVEPTSEGQRLHVFDLATRRLATLTEHAYYVPTPNAPLAADTCGQPWALRSAGGPLDGYTQDARWLFFIEDAGDGPEQPLWILPIDLSEPPRRLAMIDPGHCHPPLASPDGSLVAVSEDAPEEQSSHLTIARP